MSRRVDPNGRGSPVFPKALDAAAAAIVGRLEADYGEARNTHATARAAIRAYLTALRSTRESAPDGRYRENGCRTLAAMKVGDVIVLKGATGSVVGQRMRAARRLMDNPDARWTAETVDGTDQRVERIPDGERAAPKLKSPITLTLVGLQVGESVLMPGAKAHSTMSMHYKQKARQVLGEPNAQWSSVQKSTGVRVTRTA